MKKEVSINFATEQATLFIGPEELKGFKRDYELAEKEIKVDHDVVRKMKPTAKN